jgi:hypothetical protein
MTTVNISPSHVALPDEWKSCLVGIDQLRCVIILHFEQGIERASLREWVMQTEEPCEVKYYSPDVLKYGAISTIVSRQISEYTESSRGVSDEELLRREVEWFKKKMSFEPVEIRRTKTLKRWTDADHQARREENERQRLARIAKTAQCN